MKLLPRFSWPPSLEALGPAPSDEGSPHDPEQLVRTQHRLLARILRDLAEAAEGPAPPTADEDAEARWAR